MASARDLVSIFVALELLSIPGYMMAAWNKRERRSNEAGIKYYLMGVFVVSRAAVRHEPAVRSHRLDAAHRHRRRASDGDLIGLEVAAVVFGIRGFAARSRQSCSTVAADTDEGAPTAVTASSPSGQVARFRRVDDADLHRLPRADDVDEPLVWAMAALTMTIGNVLALRQTNIVRMLAYSSISQGGFMLMPLAFAGNPEATGSAMNAVIVYLLVYAFMNLGAFAIVIAVSRKTHSAEISSFGGLFGYVPGLAVAMTIFFASLAGIPPLGGWFAKFNAFKAVLDAGTTAAYVLAAIAAVNTVIVAAYYMRVLRVVWMDEAPDGDASPVNPPAPVVAALAITVIGTIAVGVLPNLVARVGALDALTGAFSG